MKNDCNVKGYIKYTQYLRTYGVFQQKHDLQVDYCPPTLVELVSVDDEAGGEVSHTLVMVIAISFSVFFITDELWRRVKEGEEAVATEEMYVHTYVHAYTECTSAHANVRQHMHLRRILIT